jgi:hypothetical protein
MYLWLAGQAGDLKVLRNLLPDPAGVCLRQTRVNGAVSTQMTTNGFVGVFAAGKGRVRCHAPFSSLRKWQYFSTPGVPKVVLSQPTATIS